MAHNIQVIPWEVTLKVFEDKEPRHFKVVEGKLYQAESQEGVPNTKFRKNIEPWLTALFQNEHLNLLAGNGLTCATSYLASKKSGASMEKVGFNSYPHKETLLKAVDSSAEKAGRNKANIEDQIRTANKLLEGLEILEHDGSDYGFTSLQSDISNVLSSLINSVLKTEQLIASTPDPFNREEDAARYLMSFLLSFASRTASRDRLHIFTTNYDRVIEWASDLAGIRLMDRFVGTLSPVFRSSRLDLDMHYNPPGIRGEPRYLEGLARYTKLHGSLDWSYQNKHVRKVAIPFGSESFNPYMDNPASCLIFPNSAKDRETSEYPYVELFRDFAAAICRPNTVLVCYGYGFGDEHINRVIEDMLSIPSTHLVIISLDNAGNRISNFYSKVGRPDQISLMIGTPFADIVNLVDNFLPKPAIDLTTQKVQEIITSRGWDLEKCQDKGGVNGDEKMNSPMDNLAKLQIGTVDYVAPDEIKVLLDLDAPQSVAMNTGRPRAFPRINGFVLLPTETGYIVGQVTWLAVEHSSFPKRNGMKDFGLIDLPFPLRKMCLNLLGTLENQSSPETTKYCFKRGVHTFPGLGDPVILPDSVQLKAIVESGTDGKVLIGHCPLADNAEVKVNPDKIFGRHLAVLGNTGSGKSCSVAGLIHWSLNEAKKYSEDRNPNARFIVLDPNGEYSQAFNNHNARVFKVEPSQDSGEFLLNIPAWLWNSEEWSAFTQASGRAQKPLLRRALREVRSGVAEDDSNDFRLRRRLSSISILLRAHIRSGTNYEGWKFSSKLKAMSEDLEAWIGEHANFARELHDNKTKIDDVLENRKKPSSQYYNDFSQTDIEDIINSINVTLNSLGGMVFQSGPSEDSPLPFIGSDFVDHIETLAEQETNPQFFDYLVMRIRMMLSDKRMLVVAGSERQLSLTDWLNIFIGSDNAENGCISVIDLSLVPQEIVHIVTAVISRLTFEALQRYRRKHSENKVLPTSLVMEEAHNFIKRYRDDSEEATASSMCCKVFEKIAREGRKFGLGLVLSSQRPSELSPTVLSQCNTFLLHRLTNDKDQEMVSRLLPDGLRGLLREIPALPSQHAFLVGWATELPLLTKIKSLARKLRPTSDDPDYWNVWTRKNELGEHEERNINWKEISDEWQEIGTVENDIDNQDKS